MGLDTEISCTTEAFAAQDIRVMYAYISTSDFSFKRSNG